MRFIISIFITLISFCALGNSNSKFGKISIENLNKEQSSIDASAEAEILFDNCHLSFNYDETNGFSVKKSIHKRIKIYDKEAANQFLNMEIPLYDKEKCSQLKASTYNLVKGKITADKVSKSDIYSEEINENWTKEKFAFPNVSDGSIIEIKYFIFTPYYWNLDTWYFQHSIPVMNSSHTTTIPSYFVYQPHYRGFEPHHDIKKSAGESSIVVNGRLVAFPTNRTEIIYKNLPPLKEEKYVFNMNNFRNSVTYELSSFEFPGRPIKSFSTTWKNVAKTLMSNENFGGVLTDKKNAGNELEDFSNISEDISTEEKIKLIFNKVRNEYQFNGKRSKYASQDLKSLIREKSGNVAELNFILIRALRHVGIKANPLVLSTSDNGMLNLFYPSISQLNYVITAVEVDDQLFLIDASSKYSNINTLPSHCLNYHGYILYKDDFKKIDISNSKQVKLNDITCTLTDNLQIEGKFKETLYGHRNINLRRKLENSKEAFQKEIESETTGISKSNIEFENSNDVNAPFITSYYFVSEVNTQEISGKIFIDPLLFLSQEDNPFKKEDRQFPVEIGSEIQENFNVTIKIPEGYVVEYMPDSKRFKLPDNFGSYVITVTQTENSVKVSRMLKLNKPIYNSDEAQVLRNMFLEILKIEKEKIILAKS